MTRRVWDISQVLRPGLPVWPGDTAFAQRRTWTIADGTPVNVSALTFSTHSGAHADAPLHYQADGAAIDAVALDPYLGECLVIDARGAGDLIQPHNLPELGGARRVLLRTWDRFPHDTWRSDWTAIAAGTIAALAAAGVILIGIDGPSLDPQESKAMDAHLAVAAAGMRILEGLVLDGVPAGRYELIALPLAIAGADAAPVRAVLRELT
ncbi:arylformamidase [Novosphingobium tardum]|uniref:Kynurenine formamidase n=1 Tax=Novosphingobium tardum TaxID=1538021 RepID=A0ABV8RLJ8_9SPHN